MAVVLTRNRLPEGTSISFYQRLGCSYKNKKRNTNLAKHFSERAEWNAIHG